MNYNLSRRIGLLVTLTILVLTVLIFSESVRRIYQAQLMDHLNGLEDLAHTFSQRLSIHLPQILELEGKEEWGREKRILAINSLLQEEVDALIQQDSTGLGYYSKALQAVVAIGPQEDFDVLLGISLGEDHPSLDLYNGRPMQRQVARVFRGQVARYAKLVYWQGEPVGHLWANLPVSVLYRSFLPSFLLSLFLGLLGVGMGLFLSLYITRIIKQATRALEGVMDTLYQDPMGEMIQIQEASPPLPQEFQPVYGRFSQLALQIREMNMELTISARLAALGDLVSVVAHDIRNPLSMIMARAQLGKQITTGEKDRSMYEGIIQASKLMDEFLERILLLARARKEKREWFSMDAVLSEMLELWAPLLKQKGILLQYQSHSDLPLILGDSVGFQQAFLNLLKNAIEVTPSGEKIVVNLQQKEEIIQLSITDAGPGIPEHIQEKIFNRFFTTKKQNGSGIGLALAHSVVNSQGGKIWFHTGMGKGTTFYVSIPLEPPPPHSQIKKQSSA